MYKVNHFIIALLIVIICSPAFAEGESKFSFKMDLGIGTQTFDEDGESVTYQNLNLLPELIYGKFAIGFDLSFNFLFADENGDFYFREEDWVITGDTTEEKVKSFLSIYLPIFRHIRYGEKKDPLYIKLGSIEDGTLGNGFIMGNYANTNFLPERRIFGMSLDLDGELFKFPYVGIETFVGNLALLDVMGTRLYIKPFAFLESPMIKDFEIGATYAADLDPEANFEFTSVTGDIDPVQIVGFDIYNPIISSAGFSLAAFGDFVIQPREESNAIGGMIGVGGKIVSLLPYVLQIRMLGENFVPVYFDSNYDLYREEKYMISNGDIGLPAFAGWMASLGFSLLQDVLVFTASVDGPFEIQDTDNYIGHPHLRIVLLVNEGLIPNFSFSASLDRKNLDLVSSWENFWLEDMQIGANINYNTGPAVLTLTYDLRYLPNENRWETTAKLSSSFSLF